MKLFNKQVLFFNYKSSNFLLVKNTFIYTITTVVNSAIPFFLIPVLTRYFSPVDYGYISVYAVIVAIVTPFVGYNLHGSITNLIFSDRKSELAQYVGNCIYILLGSTILFSISFLFLDDYIHDQLKIPVFWIWTSLLLAFNNFITLLLLTIWQAYNRPFYFGLYQIASTIINFSLTMLLVIYFRFDWTGRIEAQLITSVLFALIAVFILLKNNWIIFKYNKKYIKDGINFGVPLILHVIGGVFLSIINRFFIVKFVGIEEAGLYFLAFQLTSIINIFTSALNTAYVPWLFSKLELNQINVKYSIVKYTYFYFTFLILISVIFTITLPYVMNVLVGKDYFASQKYFNWLVVGCVSNGMYLMVTNYIVYTKKTHYLALTTFISSIITLGLNYLLIQIFGALGAAMANAFGFTILFIITWILSARVFKMPWLLRVN